MADTIESVDVAGVHGQVALNPDGTAIGTPVGGATSANQTNGSQKTQIVDGSGNVIGSTSNALDVNIVSGSSSGVQYTEGDTDATITGTAILFESNTTTSAVSTVSADNPLPVSVTGGGDATAANQTTIIGHVDGIETLLGTINADTSNIATNTSTIVGDTTSIDAKIPALGQALAASSVPVVLPATQITTLTPQTDALTNTQLRATAVPVDGSGVTQPVSGTITANAGTNLNTSALALEGGGNLATIAGNTTSLDTKIAIATTDDLDSGAGTDTVQVMGIAVAANGGHAVVPGDATNGLTVNLGTNNDVTVTGTVDLGATDNAVLDSIAAKDFATQTTLAAINAKLVTGTDIGDVTINNAAGASAVNIQDGGNTITVDGTVSITANSAVNVAQMNGTAVTMGNGVSGTGVQRVTIASDSTGVVGLATGSNAIGKLAANSGVDIGDVTINNASGSPVYSHEDQSGTTSERVSNTDGASTAFSNFGATASTYNYIRVITVYNSSATDGYVDFRDGTAGSVLWTMPLPAGGGATLALDAPIFRTSANTALAYDVSGALSTVYISISGYRSTT